MSYTSSINRLGPIIHGTRYQVPGTSYHTGYVPGTSGRKLLCEYFMILVTTRYQDRTYLVGPTP